MSEQVSLKEIKELVPEVRFAYKRLETRHFEENVSRQDINDLMKIMEFLAAYVNLDF